MTVISAVESIRRDQSKEVNSFISKQVTIPYVETTNKVKEQAEIARKAAKELSEKNSTQIRRLQNYQAVRESLFTNIRDTIDQVLKFLRDDQVNISERGVTAAAILAAEQLSMNEGKDLIVEQLRKDVSIITPFHRNLLLPGGAVEQKYNTLAGAIWERLDDELSVLYTLDPSPTETENQVDEIMGGGFVWFSGMADITLWSLFKDGMWSFGDFHGQFLEGWMWHATLDSRTCPACVARHGTIFPSHVQLNDHPHGRCIPIPVVAYPFGIETGVVGIDLEETGIEWFEQQSQQTQMSILGGARFRAWNQGQVNLRDFADTSHNAAYGEFNRAASLKQILGESEARKYYE